MPNSGLGTTDDSDTLCSESSLSSRAYFLALRVTNNPDWAEDVMQEAWLRFKKESALKPQDGDCKVRFLRLIHECALDWVRAEKSRKAREHRSASALEGRQSMMNDPAEVVERRELGAAARAVLTSLPVELRMPVSLCCEQGFTQAMTGEILGVTQQAVALRVEKGLASLRKELAAAGFTGASPAMLMSTLGTLSMPEAPASLAALMAQSAFAAPATPVTATAEATAKGGAFVGKILTGGWAMKIGLGVAALGLAVGASLWVLDTQAEEKPAPVAPVIPADTAVVKPTFEKFAMAVNREYLDGPKMQAMCMDHKSGWPDASGNFFFQAVMNDGMAVRVARADGMVETIIGDDRCCSDIGLTEGPACFFPTGGFAATWGGVGGVASFCSIGSPLVHWKVKKKVVSTVAPAAVCSRYIRTKIRLAVGGSNCRASWTERRRPPK